MVTVTVIGAMSEMPLQTAEDSKYLAEIKAHRAWLSEKFGSNWAEKDKIVISVSSLAFGFSIGFLDPEAGTPEFLMAAWVAFAVSIILVVLSFDVNGFQLKRTIKRIDTWVEDPVTPKPKDGTYFIKGMRVLDGINSLSVYSLIAGIILTVLFVGGTI